MDRDSSVIGGSIVGATFYLNVRRYSCWSLRFGTSVSLSPTPPKVLYYSNNLRPSMHSTQVKCWEMAGK